MEVAIFPPPTHLKNSESSESPGRMEATDMELGLGIEDPDNVDMDESMMYPGSIFDEDEDDLIDPDKAYVKGNFKRPVKGFDEDEKLICPLVDKKSAILYDIVQQLEEEELVRSLSLLNDYKKPIVFPRELLEEEEGSYILIRIVDPEEWKKKEEDRIIDAELEEQRKVLGDLPYVNDTYRIPFDHGWTREVVVRVHPTPPGAELGEYPLTSIGEVFYRDPAGNKIRSMKQIAISLEKDPIPGLSIKNFTFGKAPIGMRDQKKEIIRKIVSGKSSAQLPVKSLIKGKKVMVAPEQQHIVVPKTNGSSMESPAVAAAAGLKLKSSSSRRSIQPPKRYATGQAFAYPEKRSKTGTKRDIEFQSDNEMEMGMLPPKYPRGKEDFTGGGGGGGGGGNDDSMIRKRGRPPMKRPEEEHLNSDYNGDHDSALFQISAFHSHSLFDTMKDVDHPHDDMYENVRVSDPGHRRNVAECSSMSGQEHGTEELLPCSIRCPAMAGEIPTLQCKRCLCLYHPECLALPPNLNFKNFLCANCEGEHSDDVPSPTKQQMSGGAGGGGGGGSKPPTSNSDAERKPGWFGPKLGESFKVKKPPPPLLPAFPKFGSKFSLMNSKLKFTPGQQHHQQRSNIIPPSLGRGFPLVPQSKSGSKRMSPVSLLRPGDDSMSISPITLKRGRGRPPKSTRLLPNLSNRNLTITPISIRPRLPVPSLAPMSKGKSSLQMPLIPLKLKGSTSNSQQQHKVSSITTTTTTTKGRTSLPSLSIPGAGGRFPDSMFRDMKGVKAPQLPAPLVSKGPGGFPPFKRHIQGVVSIGTRKFVAVPRPSKEGGGAPSASKMKATNKKLANAEGDNKQIPQETESAGGEEAAAASGSKTDDTVAPEVTPKHDFENDQMVIKKIFKYLNVKDLLRAARVSSVWNKVASEENLWKVVRMKNQRISDISAFCDSLKKQNTEQIDLRKMICTEEMNWENLFQSLANVSSLKQIILGPRTVSADLVGSLSKLCPDVTVVTT